MEKNRMSVDMNVIERLYERFNERDVDGVLKELVDDVAWANGMDGGHVHGHEELRDYWTRQWAMVSPHVEPVRLEQTEAGVIRAEVLQTVTDLEGNPLEGQMHGLKNKTIVHLFEFQHGKVARFDIQDAASSTAPNSGVGSE